MTLMRQTSNSEVLFGSVLVLSLVSVASGHGSDAEMEMDHAKAAFNSTDPLNMGPPSYFRHDEHSGLMVAHIILMSIGWIFVLPLGVMFSITRSRYNFPTQFVFLIINAAGVLLAIVYNSQTPDLYTNNLHHKFAWLLTLIVVVQTCLAFVRVYVGKKDHAAHPNEAVAFIPVSSENMAEYHRFHDIQQNGEYRYSNDSGQGTERNTESLRSSSLSSAEDDIENLERPVQSRYDSENVNYEKRYRVSRFKLDYFLSNKVAAMAFSHISHVLFLGYEVVNRLILILGFVAITTGVVTYAGIFHGQAVFSGLAHFIKGAVFLWYGILTLGRWAGCFADIGWAWNVKPAETWKPSAEFLESFLIFFYGSTNVFLEHLGGWGREWTAQDLEHISITIIFFGGGLCGMLIESSKIRDLLNANVLSAPAERSLYATNSDGATSWQAPRTYDFSMNPLPALIVLLLGIMMSSHTQESMVASMIHRQWGNLLAGAALARTVTYLLFYVSPPTSFLPSRPPSELITAFCLMAGGFTFMASSSDTVAAMEFNRVHAMFVFTVTMGLITFMMAWIILVISIKGWALGRETQVGY
ncbi:MAG: hypothetical protein M1818_003137 [Claussenomyces sp. TS43310]|nr:MAG: hypothetical protein M1818_003137 [Claussenomyces sp. TS43310]